MFVTDSHPLLHYAQGKKSKLSRKSSRLFEDAERGKTLIHVPTVVLWEAARLANLGSIKLPIRFDYWYRDLAAKVSFILEPLTPEDVDEARQLPFPDPFDCLIAGTAIRLGYPLITKDQVIIDSGLVETIW
jgi:PIN domain nuclease of toxin-antitoxin system